MFMNLLSSILLCRCGGRSRGRKTTKEGLYFSTFLVARAGCLPSSFLSCNQRSLVLSRRILASINSSLGPLYSALLTLKRNQEDLKKGITLEAHLEEVRKLIALVAHLLAFHDAQVLSEKKEFMKEITLYSDLRSNFNV